MDLKELTKKYTNGEVTVVWKPSLCIHSTICWRGLPGVFDPGKRPWVAMSGADSERIVSQVKQCPSGALSFYYNDRQEEAETHATATRVEVQPNGPLLVYGTLTVKDRNGIEVEKKGVTAFCRCGQSHNKPYCDGSHSSTGFRD